MVRKAPQVKRYKASLEGYYRGEYFETEVVTFGKTKAETVKLLKEEAKDADHPTTLYKGLYKGGTGRKAGLNITPMEKVDMVWEADRTEYVEPYTRIVKGKVQNVRGYWREYGEYVIPEEEITTREEGREWES